MRTLRASGCIALSLLLVSCGKGKGDAQLAAGVHQYSAIDEGFMISVPDDPVVYGGRMSHLYRFFPLHTQADQTLIEISVSPILPPYADMPPDTDLDFLEKAYKAEPGAVVGVTSITLQGATGREFDITAGPRAGTRKRIYVAHKLRYFLEFKPSMPHAIEVADSFQLQFSVQ